MTLYGKEREKETINTLLNIDDFFGRYTDNLGHVVKFIIVAAIPFLLYTFIFIRFISFKLFMMLYPFYFVYTFLSIIGRQKQRLISYKNKRDNIYSSVEDLMSIRNIHSDGLIEYENGVICYAITTFTDCYFVDDVFAKDCEVFLEKLQKISPRYDIYGFLVSDDVKLTASDLEKLSVYKEDWAREERLGFYKSNEEYHVGNSKLYNLNFIVYEHKSKYHDLKTKVDNLINSDVVSCFRVAKVADYTEAVRIISRDSTLFVDINNILKQKYKSTDTFGSRILYFNDEKHAKPVSDLESRRVIYDE